ncbi:unnamed protein product [Auanema sp. JU1783]|nr:unnamed protein product [Auanema sp. JU1783]
MESSDSVSTSIAQAISNAQSSLSVPSEAVKHLETAEKLLLNGNHDLLDNFLDEMLAFTKCELTLILYVIDFIERACKKEPETVKKTVPVLSDLLSTENTSNVKVTKRVITVVANIYPYILKWAVGKGLDSDAAGAWEAFSFLKGRILQFIENDNEGVRTIIIKFMEQIVLAQSVKTTESESGRGDIISLSDIPKDHRFISCRKVQADANNNLKSLIDQTALSHISAQNLVSCVNVLCTIARQRPDYMGKVIEALEGLHANLPPTLGTSQVKSVRKELKLHILRILRLPSSVPFHPRLTVLLSDLGASQSEINRAIPANIAELKRKGKRTGDSSEPSTKKYKGDEEDDEYGVQTVRQKTEAEEQRRRAVDITADFIFSKLDSKSALNMVLTSLPKTPDRIPQHFLANYTPASVAGSEAQRRQIALLLAHQATEAGVGPGVQQIDNEKISKNEKPAIKEESILASVSQMKIGTLKESKPMVAQKTKLQFDLIQTTVAQKLTKEETMELFKMAFSRVMNAERRAVQGGTASLHNSILVRLASRYQINDDVFEKLMIDFIVQEHKIRTDLALLWLAELYAQYQGFSYCFNFKTDDGSSTPQVRLERYNRIMVGLLNEFVTNKLHREAIFHKILLEVPLVTPAAINFLKRACLDETFGAFSMTTLRELILTRGRQRHEMLDVLFELSFYEKPAHLRHSCIDMVREFCELPYLKTDIRNHLVDQLELLKLPNPPDFLSQDETLSVWDESTYRSALHLYIAVLSTDASLLLPLARIYAESSKDFKMVVQNSIDSAVRSIGIHNQEILKFVEECPHGAEPLVAKVVNLLTERDTVTKDLVVRLKALQEERNADVRTMIPVLNGLEKSDIIRILPQFVLKSVNQRTVRNVFKKILLGRHIDTGEPILSGVELVYEYHLIMPSTSNEVETQIENLKDLIEYLPKEAIANAVEKIIDIRPIPVLFYSTLIAVIDKYPSLDSFLSNVLQKLISKELWKESEDTKYAFFRALSHLKLVAYTPILSCFSTDEFMEYIEFHKAQGTKNETLRSLKEHLPTLSTHQQKSISSLMMDMIKGRDDRKEIDKEEREKDRERDKEREERRQREREREKEKSKKDVRRDSRKLSAE